MRILIAEDERITRTTLARQLQASGHEVTAAEDGQQAWEHFSGAGSDDDSGGGGAGGGTFDVVITDWEMPRLSGLELVRKIRETPRELYTYVIMLTSRSEKSDIVSGIEAGADDFLSKPFDRDELRVRLLAGERIVRLERALMRQNAELRDANDRIRTGLRAAARVQQSMLPRDNIINPRVRTAWKYVPTDELAGDAIGLFLVDDRFLVAYVLDVSGHGVPAALLSVSAMRALEPEPAETSVLRDLTRANPDLDTIQRPARVAVELNRRFRAGENDGRYLTMVLCVLDIHRGRLHLTSAGHPPPLLVRGGQPVTLPDAGGFPIAITDTADYEDAVVHLRPGDRLCLYSDGIIEQSDRTAAGTRDEQFGAERLLHSLTTRSGTTVDQVVNEVVDDLARWAGSGEFVDDVSLVVVEWRGAEG
jgi:sigma-B regulation protein RsbU (phosphoserine phosphatase)